MDAVKGNEALREIGGVPIPVYMDDAYLMFGNSIERQVTDFETAINAGPFPVGEGWGARVEEVPVPGNRVPARSE